MAGPCAECAFSIRAQEEMEGKDWFEFLCDVGNWEAPDTDEGKVLLYAKAVESDEKRAWRFIRRMAKWTEDAVHERRTARVIHAPAALLMEKKTVSGEAAVELVRQEGPGRCPSLAYKWRRRFASLTPGMPL